MKIGCLNKNTNRTEYTYISSRFKTLPAPFGKDPYVQYEMLEIADKYIWDESSESVIVDPNYVEPTPDYVEIATNTVKQARDFGSDLINQYAGENVALGVTQLGKTAEVLSVMETQVELDPVNKPGIKISMINTLSSGSLYETMKVIDYHITKCQNGDYDNISTFINETRLNSMKSEIESYLGV